MRKRRVAWVILAALVLGAGGVAVWLAWPSPYQGAFDQITLGADEAAVEQLMAELPHRTPPPHRRELILVAWAGVVDGHEEQYRSRTSALPRNSPVTRSPRRWLDVECKKRWAARQQPGYAVIEYRDRTTGRLRGRWCVWSSGPDMLGVLFDPDGRAVEKEYLTDLPGLPWWERAGRAVGRFF